MNTKSFISNKRAFVAAFFALLVSSSCAFAMEQASVNTTVATQSGNSASTVDAGNANTKTGGTGFVSWADFYETDLEKRKRYLKEIEAEREAREASTVQENWKSDLFNTLEEKNKARESEIERARILEEKQQELQRVFEIEKNRQIKEFEKSIDEKKEDVSTALARLHYFKGYLNSYFTEEINFDTYRSLLHKKIEKVNDLFRLMKAAKDPVEMKKQIAEIKNRLEGIQARVNLNLSDKVENWVQAFKKWDELYYQIDELKRGGVLTEQEQKELQNAQNTVKTGAFDRAGFLSGRGALKQVQALEDVYKKTQEYLNDLKDARIGGLEQYDIKNANSLGLYKDKLQKSINRWKENHASEDIARAKRVKENKKWEDFDAQRSRRTAFKDAFKINDNAFIDEFKIKGELVTPWDDLKGWIKAHPKTTAAAIAVLSGAAALAADAYLGTGIAAGAVDGISKTETVQKLWGVLNAVANTDMAKGLRSHYNATMDHVSSRFNATMDMAANALRTLRGNQSAQGEL